MTDPAIVEILAKFLDRARFDGVEPSDVAYVITDGLSADRVVYRGERPGPSDVAGSVVVVTATGHFVAPRSPIGVPRPQGSNLTMVYGRDNRMMHSLHISDTRPDLSALGPVVALRP